MKLIVSKSYNMRKEASLKLFVDRLINKYPMQLIGAVAVGAGILASSFGSNQPISAHYQQKENQLRNELYNSLRAHPENKQVLEDKLREEIQKLRTEAPGYVDSPSYSEWQPPSK